MPLLMEWNKRLMQMLHVRLGLRKSLWTVLAGLLAIWVQISLAAQDVPAHNPDGLISVRGTIASASAMSVTVNTADGPTMVKFANPFHLYAPVKSDLSQVKDTSFIGVTTVQGPDGKPRATEVHIFPEELRGIGEGSYPWSQGGGGDASRMTNGQVSESRMTNGTATQAKMSKSAKRKASLTLVVEYQGGTQTITVPPNTPVTEIQLIKKKLAAGDQVTMFAKKWSDGKLTANAATLESK